MESFREMYERCYMQREDKLNQLKVWQFLIFLDHSCELWCFLGPSSLLNARIFSQVQILTSSWQGKVKNCYKAEKEKHRETKMAYADIAPKAPRSVQKAQVDMNIPESLSDSAVAWSFNFFLFRWRMAPLLPQDRPWNQSEGSNCQWQLKVQVTSTDPNGPRKIWVYSDFGLHIRHLSDVWVIWESKSNW